MPHLRLLPRIVCEYFDRLEILQSFNSTFACPFNVTIPGITDVSQSLTDFQAPMALIRGSTARTSANLPNALAATLFTFQLSDSSALVSGSTAEHRPSCQDSAHRYLRDDHCPRNRSHFLSPAAHNLLQCFHILLGALWNRGFSGHRHFLLAQNYTL
jgi:hypothetical protein